MNLFTHWRTHTLFPVWAVVKRAAGNIRVQTTPAQKGGSLSLSDMRQEWLRGHRTLTSACGASIPPVVLSLWPGPGLGRGDTAEPGQRHPCLRAAARPEGASIARGDEGRGSQPAPPREFASCHKLPGRQGARAYEPHFRDEGAQGGEGICPRSQPSGQLSQDLKPGPARLQPAAAWGSLGEGEARYGARLGPEKGDWLRTVRTPLPLCEGAGTPLVDRRAQLASPPLQGCRV